MSFGGGQAAATIRSNTTPAQDAAAGKGDSGVGPAATPTTSVNDYLAANKQYQGFPIAPPKDAPDITDELLQRARNSFALRLQRGNRQSNNYGAQLGGFSLDKPILGGQ